MQVWNGSYRLSQSPVPVRARHKLQDPRKEGNSLKHFFPYAFHSEIPLFQYLLCNPHGALEELFISAFV